MGAAERGQHPARVGAHHHDAADQQYRMQTYDVESHRVIAWRAPLHLRLGTGTTTGAAAHAGVCGSDHYYSGQAFR